MYSPTSTRAVQNFIAIDLGASSGRVILATWDGQSIELSVVHRFPTPYVETSEGMFWVFDQLWQEVEDGIRKVATTLSRITSIGVDSWAVDFGLIGKDGKLLAPPRHYRDVRNIAAAEEVVAQVGHSALYQQSGTQFLPFNTLYQLYALAKHEPSVLARAESLLLMPDLLNYMLTGERRAEFTNASTTQMLRVGGTIKPTSDGLVRSTETLAANLIAAEMWNTKLLEGLRLPTHILPAIVQPGGVLGTISHPNLTGIPALRETLVTHTASHDTAAAVVSVPWETPDYAYICSGTWSLVGTVTPHPVITAEAMAGNFTNEGGVRNNRLLKNVMGLWLLQETQRNLREAGEDDNLDTLLGQAAMARPLGSLFDPDSPSLLQPGDMRTEIRRLCRESGEPVPDTTGQVVRAILESLAMKYRVVLDDLETLTGARYRTVHVVGGGSQNRLLNQFTANATNRLVICGPVESSSLGNVLVQLMAVGEIRSTSEVHEIVRRSATTTRFEPESDNGFDSAIDRFKSIIQRRNQA